LLDKLPRANGEFSDVRLGSDRYANAKFLVGDGSRPGGSRSLLRHPPMRR